MKQIHEENNKDGLHSILEWSNELGLYVVPMRDLNLNDGKAILSDDSILKVIRATSKALHSLHKQGICHGMIEPENIMINDEGKVRLSGLENINSIVYPKHDSIEDEIEVDSVKERT